MESKCHNGRTCTYGIDKLALNIRHHALSWLLSHYLEDEDAEDPICGVQSNCTECEEWTYV
jgi:putative lipase involved disintegration of autophagic bodies